MNIDTKAAMRKLRSTRRANDTCANCGVHSKSYLCPSCKDLAIERKQRHKQGIKKDGRSPRRLRVWDISTGNVEFMYALISNGIDFQNREQLDLLAASLDCTTRTIQRWIFEDRSPSKKKWETLELIFGKPIYSLFPQLAVSTE